MRASLLPAFAADLAIAMTRTLSAAGINVSRLAARLTPLVRTPKVARAYGALFKLDLREYVERQMFWRLYEVKTVAWWQRSIGRGAIVIDVGANVGLFSILAGLRGARTFAFEPHPQTLKKLRHNVALNKCAALVTVDPRAVCAMDGRVKLFEDVNASSDMRNAGVASLSSLNAGGRSYSVDATTIDDFVREAGLTRVDFLKIDVQGAEFVVLQGAINTLRQFRPMIVLEHDPEQAGNCGHSWAGIADLLSRCGYGWSTLEAQNVLAQPSCALQQGS